MLVLSRKVGEAIHIGENIVVIVHSVTHSQGSTPIIRLAIEAPPEIEIWREEIKKKRDQQKLEKKENE